MKSCTLFFLLTLASCGLPTDSASEPRPPQRLRDLGVTIGSMRTGPRNSITDVSDVAVGHETLVEGRNVRTGVTVIVPQFGKNTYRNPVPAAVFTANGYGKAVGFTQVVELGELESPIALTNTLSVAPIMAGMVGHALEMRGNENVRSVNVVVGETNDGWLNDIRKRSVNPEHFLRALANATTGDVEEGCVGAGTGTTCLGFKGGIGTSSRVTPGGWTVGVLVQTNFDGVLTIRGREFHPAEAAVPDEDGSCMIVVATDAPVDPHGLERIAKRAVLGLARTGSNMANGSGDYIIAFSTRRYSPGRAGNRVSNLIPLDAYTPIFAAVAEATEEAILNSMTSATTTKGVDGNRAAAVPHDHIRSVFSHFQSAP